MAIVAFGAVHLLTTVEVSAAGVSVQGRSPMGRLPLVGRKASLVRG
jgi:hypothetical protein